VRLFLEKNAILNSAIEIDNLFRYGVVYKGVLFDIIYQAATDTKVMFAVSKNIKTIVRKNRVKRLLREMFRMNQNKIAGHFSIIIIAKEVAFQSSLFELNSEFQAFIASSLQ